MRKLTLDSGVWEWEVGRSNVVIKSPAGVKSVVDFATLTGWDWCDIERGQWKRYFSIKPSCVKEYIENHLGPCT